MIDEKEVTAYVTIPDCFLQGCSEDIVIFRADGGNHFTDYGIYEGMFLFFDRKKRFKKGRLLDNDVLAYRVLLEKRKENAPFWEKKVLTVEEAAEYTGIGRTKIRQIIMRGDCPFAVTNGVQVCVIRDKFIDYLDKQFSI